MGKIPTVTSQIPRDLRTFVDRVRESLDGNSAEGAVTTRQLVAAGIASYNGNTLGPALPSGQPTRPKNVEAAGALANIMVTWDKPAYQGHAFAEIWAAAQTEAQEDATPPENPSIGQAVLVGMAPGTFFAHNIGAGGKRWYWVRFVNFAGSAGTYQSTEGIVGETGQDPVYLLDLLTGQLSESALSTALSERIDLIDGASSLQGSVANRLLAVQSQVGELLNLPTWASTTAYTTGAQVVHQGFLYVALADSTNVVPGTSAVTWDEIGQFSTIGGAVSAHSTQIDTLVTDVASRATETNTLAAQMRGDYTGEDVTVLAQGLIHSEREARATADSAIATSVETLTAFTNTKTRVFYQETQPAGTTESPLLLGDMWINTAMTLAEDYLEEDYAIRSNRMYRYDGEDWIEAIDYGFADSFAAIRSEKTARVTEDSALATQITTLDAVTGANIAGINQTLTTHTTDISSTASALTTLTSSFTGAVGTLSSAIQEESKARSDAFETTAGQITTLQSTTGENTVALATESGTRATQTGDLFAQYTVKTDLNGYVSGYGLASSVVNGVPSSEFSVRADSFNIAAPDLDADGQLVSPFIVRTTPTEINGVEVPAGVYMTDAFIANGTISNAKIGNAAIDDAKIASLDAGKITAGFIDAARIQAGSISAGMIDSRGLSIKDADGNVILSAGSPLDISNIAGLGTLAAFSDISLSYITDAGDLAGLNEITEANLASGLAGAIDGKMESWFQTADPSTPWLDADNDVDVRATHLGDMWWQATNADNEAVNKLSRYKYEDSVYSWEALTDQAAVDAYSLASTAKDTADGKRRVFITTPTVPYDEGDLWDRGSATGLYRATASKVSPAVYSGDDWQVIADKTGDNVAASISSQGNFATLDKVTAANISTYIAGAAITNAYIGNTIQSASYKAATEVGGPAGWKIDKTGAMEMNNATFRGTLDIDAGTGSRLVITDSRIEVYQGSTLRVRLGEL